jgi:hypothetical protein
LLGGPCALTVSEEEGEEEEEEEEVEEKEEDPLILPSQLLMSS